MKNLSVITGIVVSVLVIASCQPENSSRQEVPSNGKVLTGELSGNEFTIATGNEDEIFMEMIESFNRMDAEALWSNSAETVTMHSADGTVNQLTQDAMAGFFSTLDSLSWEMDAIIPVKVVGSNQVKIMADGREILYMKDGTVRNFKLFEEFIFENGQLVEVRQWTANMAEDM